MNLHPVTTKIFQAHEDLYSFIRSNVKKLRDSSILAVTSKIVALSEGRVAIAKDAAQKARIIRKESEWAIPAKYAWLTLKDGIIMANAGIDDSNANGKLILLPKNSFDAANKLHKKLRAHYKIKNLGVVITDSHVRPNRSGIIGIALGYAGFQGIKDYRGSSDIFGRKMKITQLNIADSIATACVLVMGEGRERRPLAIVEDAPVKFTNRVDKKELLIEMKDDMYWPIFRPHSGRGQVKIAKPKRNS